MFEFTMPIPRLRDGKSLELKRRMENIKKARKRRESVFFDCCAKNPQLPHLKELFIQSIYK